MHISTACYISNPIFTYYNKIKFMRNWRLLLLQKSAPQIVKPIQYPPFISQSSLELLKFMAVVGTVRIFDEQPPLELFRLTSTLSSSGTCPARFHIA